MVENPRCRVLLLGERSPRENIEVFSQNGSNGIATIRDRAFAYVRVTEGWGGWYEDGMQCIDAEAGLNPSQPIRYYAEKYEIPHTVINNAIRDFEMGKSWGLRAWKSDWGTMYAVKLLDFESWYAKYMQNKQKRDERKSQGNT
jgi:hypothetical protein